jgi:hypothetical protein
MPRLIKRPNLAGLGDAATSNIPAKRLDQATQTISAGEDRTAIKSQSESAHPFSCSFDPREVLESDVV